jgi:hypothetical protein
MIVCQWIVLAWTALNVVLSLCKEAMGKDSPEERALGVCVALAIWASLFGCLYGAGAFSLIFGGSP